MPSKAAFIAGEYRTKPDFPTFADRHYEMQVFEAILLSAKDKARVKVGSGG